MVKGLYFIGNMHEFSGDMVNLGNPTEYMVEELAKLIKEKSMHHADRLEPIDNDDPKRRKPDNQS